MRRFLQAWGRQEPLSLSCCPAEAASPPPLFSSFQSSPPSGGTILPEPPQLFTNIDRQLSAKLSAAETTTLLFGGGAAGGGQPQSQPSPPQLSPPQTTLPSELASPQQSQPPPPELGQHQTALPSANNGHGNLLAVAAAAAVAQQQQNAAANSASILHQSSPPAKGLDAFFAALASANPVKQSSSAEQQPTRQTVIDQQNSSQIISAQSATTTATLLGIQPSPLGENGIGQQATAGEQLASSLQVAATNAIANAVNAVNLMSAAATIVVQQQQQQVQKQQSVVPLLVDNPHANGLLQSAAILQTSREQEQQMGGLNNAAATLQLAQQQQQMRGPLSPVGAQIAQQTAAAAFLNRLSTPNILRPGPAQSKPIPLVEDKVDLLQFKRREPREWSSDDVVAWILDVARRHQIPCENINLAKFASCTGPLLMLMNEQSFKEHDQNYGTLLFGEFCKLVTDENFIDEWMMRTSSLQPGPSHQQQPQQPPADNVQQRLPLSLAPATNNNPVGNLLAANLALRKLTAAGPLLDQSAGPSSSSAAIPAVQQSSAQPQLLLAAAAGIAAVQQQQQQKATAIPSLGQLLQPPVTNVPPPALLRLHHPPPQPNHPQHIAASLSKILPPHHPMAASSNQIIMAQRNGAANAQAGGSAGIRPLSKRYKEQPIRRNKDGRPRKRSQHTKGNKLWEFIRDALKDPRTCPSIVRWEDPTEGVFRIVESERLAYLWGQKKNNQKMTYEKLSRAMRTYYEKEILVPVPKSGLYPKKLVYKFGPSALGWKTAATIAVQTQLAVLGPHHHAHSY